MTEPYRTPSPRDFVYHVNNESCACSVCTLIKRDNARWLKEEERMRPTLRQTVDAILAEFNAGLIQKRHDGHLEEIDDADIIEVDHFPITNTIIGLGGDVP